MRKQFVETEKRAVAVAECPWASKIVKVVGGYYAFESTDDYNTWKAQR